MLTGLGSVIFASSGALLLKDLKGTGEANTVKRFKASISNDSRARGRVATAGAGGVSLPCCN